MTLWYDPCGHKHNLSNWEREVLDLAGFEPVTSAIPALKPHLLSVGQFTQMGSSLPIKLNQ